MSYCIILYVYKENDNSKYNTVCIIVIESLRNIYKTWQGLGYHVVILVSDQTSADFCRVHQCLVVICIYWMLHCDSLLMSYILAINVKIRARICAAVHTRLYVRVLNIFSVFVVTWTGYAVQGFVLWGFVLVCQKMFLEI